MHPFDAFSPLSVGKALRCRPMELVVQCPCGQSFAFQEEPIGGRLRVPVHCPGCGSDRTTTANDYVGRMLRGENPLAVRKRSCLPFGLGRKPRGSDADAESFKSQAEPSQPAFPRGAVATPARLVFGILAALVVGALGAWGWYWVAMETGFHFGFLAWVLGGLVGLACRLIVPQGSFLLASLSGLSAFVAILAGHVLVTQAEVDKLIHAGVARAYDTSLDYARSALALKTDAEVKAFLAEHFHKASRLAAKTGKGGGPSKLTASQQRQLYLMSFVLYEVMNRGEGGLPSFADWKAGDKPDLYAETELADFRENELPELRRLLEGQPAKEAWKASLTAAIRERIRLKEVITASIGPHTIAWMAFGLITAFKLAQNRSETEEL